MKNIEQDLYKDKIVLKLREIWHELDDTEIDEITLEPILGNIDKIIVAIDGLL